MQSIAPWGVWNTYTVHFDDFYSLSVPSFLSQSTSFFFFKHVSFYFACYLYFWSFHIRETIQYLTFDDGHISLSIWFSYKCLRFTLLWLNSLLCLYKYTFLIHSSFDWHKSLTWFRYCKLYCHKHGSAYMSFTLSVK